MKIRGIRITRKRFAIAILLLLILKLPLIPFGFYIGTPTGSMYPTITGCDIMVYGPGEPEEDAIMMYWDDPWELQIHRIVEETPEGYITKGDNKPEPDDGVKTKEDMVAKIYGVIYVPLPKQVCTALYRPPFNLYFDFIGSEKSFKDFVIDEKVQDFGPVLALPRLFE